MIMKLIIIVNENITLNLYFQRKKIKNPLFKGLFYLMYEEFHFFPSH